MAYREAADGLGGSHLAIEASQRGFDHTGMG
jgi:hypothetical protein